jgi:DNA-binding PadR family transcriptional regulator
MATGNASFRYFILGLLTQRSMSGYDVKQFLKDMGWIIGNPSFGMIYPSLHTLLKDGLVTVEVFPQENKPPRKIYSITAEGERALQEWINQSGTSQVSLRAFVMHLLLASNFSPDRLIAYLQERRAQVATYHADLKQMIEADADTDLGRRLALDYSLVVAGAELDWLDGTLQRLSMEMSLQDVVEMDRPIQKEASRG